MKILYVTRKFPPTVGGMENVAAWLYEALVPKATVKLIKFGGANKYLPVVYPWLFVRALFAGWRMRPDIVYVQDGVMGPMGAILRVLLNRPVVVTIHGTEMVYGNKLYDKTVIPALQKLDGVAVISHATEEKVVEKLPNVPRRLIHWGVKDDVYLAEQKHALRSRLAESLGVELADRPLICLVGRLIERKGALWFVENVMPTLVQTIPNLACIIGGKGEEEQAVADAINRLGLENNVYAVGYVLGEKRQLLYNAADIFVMPNRKGFGFEGFGMVAIEASSCGTPVAVGRFSGVTDAVIDGKTGWLLPVDDIDAYVARLTAELQKPSLKRENIRATTLKEYDWDKTADEYLGFFQDIIKGTKRK